MFFLKLIMHENLRKPSAHLPLQHKFRMLQSPPYAQHRGSSHSHSKQYCPIDILRSSCLYTRLQRDDAECCFLERGMKMKVVVDPIHPFAIHRSKLCLLHDVPLLHNPLPIRYRPLEARLLQKLLLHSPSF